MYLILSCLDSLISYLFVVIIIISFLSRVTDSSSSSHDASLHLCVFEPSPHVSAHSARHVRSNYSSNPARSNPHHHHHRASHWAASSQMLNLTAGMWTCLWSRLVRNNIRSCSFIKRRPEERRVTWSGLRSTYSCRVVVLATSDLWPAAHTELLLPPLMRGSMIVVYVGRIFISLVMTPEGCFIRGLL